MKTYIKHNSLAIDYPELLEEWDYEKNQGVDPNKLKSGSNRKVWWICKNNPNHRWKTSASCRGRNGRITQCLQCYNEVKLNNSLAKKSPDTAAQWHPTKNGDLTPDKVNFGSSKKVWWQCKNNPNHAWKLTINTKRIYNSGCPYCYNKKIDIDNCLATVRPDLIEEWHPTKNDITPYEVSRGSGKIVWWICRINKDHIWQTQVRRRINNNCPQCVMSKGEEKIAKFLDSKNIEYKRQYVFLDCKYIYRLMFDFAVFKNDKLSFLIEYQGQQHFEPIKRWGGQKSFELTQIRDKIKKDYCETNNIPLLIILYSDYDNIENILEQCN